MAFIELHILQNFAPSNLNRDETNTPKSTQFGGYRRARISSQCLKRQIRKHPDFAFAIEEAGGDVGVRTKRVARDIVSRLMTGSKEEETSQKVAERLLGLAKLKIAKAFKTQYLLYLGKREIDQLAAIANEYWDELSSKEKDFSKEVGEAVKNALGKKSYAADVALFGRMVADNKEVNVDAACQVAHALSTNEVKMEMDFFTAVDDFLGADEQGSDMMGSVYFNSSCYYRYAQINLDKLAENLGNDKDLVLASIKGFIKSSIAATPTGKQNSSAAQNPVCYIRVCVRNSGSPWSLANAFTQPVRPKRDGSSNIETDSAIQLEHFMQQLEGMYGSDGFVFNEASSYLDNDKLSNNYKPVNTLVDQAVIAVNEIIGG